MDKRIGIARALITNPDFIIADEPISALDVSIQAQVVNLLNDLKADFGLTYLFIAHDLSMVHYISDRIAVMHLGRLVEMGTSDDINYHPIHPYTKFHNLILIMKSLVKELITIRMKLTTMLEHGLKLNQDILS